MRSSSATTARVTAGGDIANRRAADAKLCASATATKTRMLARRSIALFRTAE